jgi:hypothetical protein
VLRIGIGYESVMCKWTIVWRHVTELLVRGEAAVLQKLQAYCCNWSRDRSARKVTSISRTGQPNLGSRHGQGFVFATASRVLLEPTQPGGLALLGKETRASMLPFSAVLYDMNSAQFFLFS